ncbi:MAG: flagellar protein FliS [Anaerolineaceae bacterium]|nr:flagellar protein FliS [Anaerolineaceae bacterium]
MYKSPYLNKEYQKQEVNSATPLHLVIMAYDLAIKSCEHRDFQKATNTIGCLRDALDFDVPEVSMGLFKIYQYCLDNIRKGNYEAASATLVELRDAWKQTEQRLSNRPAPKSAPLSAHLTA